MKVVTRFAPSPTGYLHIGGLRTALFSYLWAKKHSGSFRIRIEDTDQTRKVDHADVQLLKLLSDLGLQHDGEVIYQSNRARKGIYAAVAKQLVTAGHAYYCFCSIERLAKLRKDQIARKQSPGYDGACRSINYGNAKRRIAQGERATIRLKWNRQEKDTVTFYDELKGDVAFPSASIEDVILLKSDSFPTYHLAHVVDDHAMHVTHIIRGEEWLPSAPLHDALYAHLQYPRPAFYHIPLILNPDKSKLSKRQGHVSVEHYLNMGYLKEALINYIAFLGWNPGSEREIFSLDELIQEFDIARVHSAGAIFDVQKLNWYNAWYIKNVLATKKTEEIAASVKKCLPQLSDEEAHKLFILFFERISCLTELEELSGFLRDRPDYPASLLIFKKSTAKKTKHGLQTTIQRLSESDAEWTTINLELVLKQIVESEKLSFGDVFWPVRAALSGQKASPPPADLLAYLGKNESINRLQIALDKL